MIKSKQELSLLNNKIAIISDTKLLGNTNPEYRLTAYATLLCTKGQANLVLNNLELKLQTGDLLVCMPGSMIEGRSVSENFQTIGFYLSHQFFEALTEIPIGLLDSAVYIAEHPLTHIDEQAVEIFTQYYELIRSKLNSESNENLHNQLVTDLLIQAFMYEFHDAMEKSVKLESRSIHFTSGDNLRKNFMQLLLQSYPKPRSVAWYADKLNVTPKYLSNVCKQLTGKNASAIIDQYVLEDVKRNLMRPEKSVKQIVRELDFASISFFGKYVKKHLGMSPKHYRKTLEIRNHKPITNS